MHVSLYVPETASARSSALLEGATVGAILSLAELRDAELLAGASRLGQPVSVPIVLKPGQLPGEKGAFVVATIDRDDALETWFRQLGEAAVAGVLLVGQKAPILSSVAVATAEEAGLPVATLAASSAGSLVRPIYRLLEGGPTKGLVLGHQLMRLAIDGAGLDQIATALAEQLGGPVIIEDRQFNLLASSNPSGTTSTTYDEVIASNGTPLAVLKTLEDSGALRQMRSDKTPMTLSAGDGRAHSRTMRPVTVGGEIFGYLSAVGVSPEVEARANESLEYAVNAVAIELLKQKGIAETEQKMRRDFFRDLLFSNGNISAEALHRRATYLGYQLSTSYWSVVVEFDQVPNEELLPDEVKRLVSTLNSLLSFRQALVISQTQGATILYPVKEGQPNLEKVKHLAETIRQKITQSSPGWTVSIGIGQIYPDLLSIPRSYREAQHAVKIGRALNGTTSITCFAELGIYRMLLQFAQSQNPNEFFCEALERLLEYDQQADKELVKTLTAFLECNGNLTETSDRLFIHRNTLKYRLERIRDITQIDLDDSENRLMLHLGLKMNQIVSTLK